MKTKEVNIKDDVRKAAMELACPTVKEMSLADVKKSPVKVMCTTRAQIASAEIPREVLVKGVQTQIKEVQLKEGKERVKLTLWRDFSKIDLPVGNWVQFSNLTTRSYQDEISLSTTSRTTIKVKYNFF
ncbi:hypothetical protein FSP39_011515 [Pinctada imbricata]|uniref:Uncharacterized protein n=1 Tax=Pinctada imbricata TaxID=66713 RepID=A0AA88YNP7_PINIB|nr:hypothetical protein FSP39_011515 [Pinctada imbricata]